MIIKLEYYHDKTCTAKLQVLSMRPANIAEKKLGEIVEAENSNYHVDDDGKIYKEMNFIDKHYTVTELREAQEEAQVEFSLKIDKLRKQLEQFKLLKKITEEE